MRRDVFSKRMKTLFVAIIFTTMFLACFLPGGSADTVSFTVVDAHVLPFTDKYCHRTYSQGTLVSHFALAESRIGLTTNYATAQRHFSLTYSGKTITFEIGSSVAFDSERQYDQHCDMVVSGEYTLFMLPVEFICDYFGWNWNPPQSTKYGDMLRITTRKNSMSDRNFLEIFDTTIEDKMLETFPTQPLSPSSPNSAISPRSPTPSPTPSAGVSPSPPPVPISVYITFEGGPNELTNEFLDVLDTYGKPATFFMRGTHMAEYPADMRRLAAAASFAVGLGGYDREEFYTSPENIPDILNADNEALYACTLTKTMLVRVPGNRDELTDEMSRQLILNGYRYWAWTVDARTASTGGKIYDTVTGSLNVLVAKADIAPEPWCVLMLSQDSETLGEMDMILSYLSDKRFTVLLIEDSTAPKNSRKDHCTLGSLLEER